MKHLVLLALLLAPPQLYAQSLTFSSGNNSTILSSSAHTVEAKQPQYTAVQQPLPPTVVQPQKVIKDSVVERFLISEPWCSPCRVAKARFLQSGGKAKNVITLAEAKRRFNKSPNSIPFEFTATIYINSINEVKSSNSWVCNCSNKCSCGCQQGVVCKCNATTTTASSSESSHAKHLREVHGIDPTGMSEEQIRQAHNKAHGGGNWYFPNESKNTQYITRRRL